MKTRRIYTRELYKQFRYLATWLPGTPLALGDIGVLRQKEFTKIGNLSDHGITFDIESDPTPADLDYTSKSSVSIATKLSGSATPEGSSLSEIDAGISVNFSKENSILFQAKNTKTPTIKDQIHLGEEILRLYKNGKWNKDWVVITELVTSESASILISGSKESKIDLKVKGEIGNRQIDIADADLDFELSFSKDMSTKIVAQEGLTPLFKVSKIRSRFILPPVFTERGLKAIDFASPNMVENKKELFYFGEPDFEIDDDNHID